MSAAAELPALQRWHDRHPVPPWKLGVAIFLGLSAAFLVVELALGRHADYLALPVEERSLMEVRLALLNFLLVGYLVASCLAHVTGARRTIAAIVPHADLEPGEAEALVAAPGQVRRAVLWRSGMLGIAVALSVPLLTDPWYVFFNPLYWNPEVVWHRVTTLLIGWFVGRLMGLVIEESRGLNRLAPRVRVDLFDLRALEPFARQGLSHALAVLGFQACLLLFLVEGRYGAMVATTSALSVAIAAAGLLLPLRGAHRRIRAAKQELLADVGQRLRDAGRGLMAGAEGPPGRVADLVALESRVDAVNEWPIRGQTVARFGLYLLIPLGSWLGGALVERALAVVVP